MNDQIEIKTGRYYNPNKSEDTDIDISVDTGLGQTILGFMQDISKFRQMAKKKDGTPIPMPTPSGKILALYAGGGKSRKNVILSIAAS